MRIQVAPNYSPVPIQLWCKLWSPASCVSKSVGKVVVGNPLAGKGHPVPGQDWDGDGVGHQGHHEDAAVGQCHDCANPQQPFGWQGSPGLWWWLRWSCSSWWWCCWSWWWRQCLWWWWWCWKPISNQPESFSAHSLRLVARGVRAEIKDIIFYKNII